MKRSFPLLLGICDSRFLGGDLFPAIPWVDPMSCKVRNVRDAIPKAIGFYLVRAAWEPVRVFVGNFQPNFFCGKETLGKVSTKKGGGMWSCHTIRGPRIQSYIWWSSHIFGHLQGPHVIPLMTGSRTHLVLDVRKSEDWMWRWIPMQLSNGKWWQLEGWGFSKIFSHFRDLTFSDLWNIWKPLVLQIPCEKVFIHPKPTPKPLAKGLEHKGTDIW